MEEIVEDIVEEVTEGAAATLEDPMGEGLLEAEEVFSLQRRRFQTDSTVAPLHAVMDNADVHNCSSGRWSMDYQAYITTERSPYGTR